MRHEEVRALIAAVLIGQLQECPVERRTEAALKWADQLLGPPRQTPKKKNAPLDPAEIPGLNIKAFTEYTEYRRRIGKALTPYARELAAKKLAEAGDAAFQQAVVDRSISGAWLGLFPESTPGHRRTAGAGHVI